MFGKDLSQLSSGYTNTKEVGSVYLRNTIRAKIYSGDSIIEEKLMKSQLYWKFYNNAHWAKNNDTLLSFNYVRAVIDKVNNFIIGKEGFEINIYDTYGDPLLPEVETVFEALVNYNWKLNKKKTLLQKILQMGAICGDVFIYCSPNIEKGFVDYTIMDSRVVIPMFKDGDYSDVIGYRVVKPLGTNDKEYIQKVTEHLPGKVITYFVKDTGAEQERFSYVETPNAYDFIPIVHIENIPMSDAFGGKSDMEDIAKINKIYNEMAEDVKNIIDYYAQPTTVITGGTVGQLRRGLNQIWSGLPAEASVFNLSLGEDLAASTRFLELLKNSIHDLSGVPEEVLSKVQHISNTSAAALQMLYQPIIQASDKKAVSYGEGFEELHRMTCVIFAFSIQTHPLFVKLPDVAKSDPKKYFTRYRAEPSWKYNLPSDRLGMLNEATIELKQKIGSRKEIMTRLGKKNIPLLLAEIEKDIADEIANEKALNEASAVEPPMPQTGEE